ncbi:MAG: HMG-box domain-containing protein [Candidatus Odinarchaeota archaeon]|nr:HMG-box domain-containing protein [Candidatus Odinarchaeota archaeon]
MRTHISAWLQENYPDKEFLNVLDQVLRCIEARKKLDKDICIRTVKKKRGFFDVETEFIEIYKKPHAPTFSDNQQINREVFRLIMERWNTLSEEEKQYWESIAERPCRGHNAFVKHEMLYNKDYYLNLLGGWGRAAWGVSRWGA